ncbi:hypothetical protein D9615_005818 [Tricholomella constricta]|uniref:Uncharacterized protein n=1 Tax=Tricholomella constricta TaxID=117010 RepID=A0A8H5HAH7_9AGAR|nr:hypothetical protein D9615_005818 [Tricholomella constricta]
MDMQNIHIATTIQLPCSDEVQYLLPIALPTLLPFTLTLTPPHPDGAAARATDHLDGKDNHAVPSLLFDSRLAPRSYRALSPLSSPLLKLPLPFLPASASPAPRRTLKHLAVPSFTSPAFDSISSSDSDLSDDTANLDALFLPPLISCPRLDSDADSTSYSSNERLEAGSYSSFNSKRARTPVFIPPPYHGEKDHHDDDEYDGFRAYFGDDEDSLASDSDVGWEADESSYDAGIEAYDCFVWLDGDLPCLFAHEDYGSDDLDNDEARFTSSGPSWTRMLDCDDEDWELLCKSLRAVKSLLQNFLENDESDSYDGDFEDEGIFDDELRRVARYYTTASCLHF